MADSIKIGKMEIENKVSGQQGKMAYNAIFSHLNKNPKDMKTCRDVDKIISNKVQEAINRINQSLDSTNTVIQAKSNGKPVLKSVKERFQKNGGKWEYTVKQGDSYIKIAGPFYEHLKKKNTLKGRLKTPREVKLYKTMLADAMEVVNNCNPKKLQIGQVITMPTNYNEILKNVLPPTKDDLMKTWYFTRWGDDSWDIIQNKVSRARNQYFEKDEIKKLNSTKSLTAGTKIKLPPVRIINCTSIVSNREFLGEKYKVRIRDTFKSVFEKLVAIRCDSSITKASLLELNNLPAIYLVNTLPLPPVLKLPKPKNATRISDKGKAFLKLKEGRIPYIYNDTFDYSTRISIPVKKNGLYTFFFDEHQSGNATIGIGHKLHDGPAKIDEDKQFLQMQGTHWVIKPIKESDMDDMIAEWWRDDIRAAETKINTITIPLNQNQFDALASLAFNRGEYFDKLKPFLEKCDYKGATDKWKEFDHPERRGEEIAIFLTEV